MKQTQTNVKISLSLNNWRLVGGQLLKVWKSGSKQVHIWPPIQVALEAESASMIC
jgi:hypothetical protein